MTHELKNIVAAFLVSQHKGIRTVLATVVDLDGSSYRKPGVRMLIKEDGEMLGAVSGGCVEKEVCRQALSVFKTGQAKMMTYDGRFRLGCEGVLYILLEFFQPDQKCLYTFQDYIKSRKPFDIVATYDRNEGEISGIGSSLYFDSEQPFPCSKNVVLDKSLSTFQQTMEPCFQLIIIGTEHDAVHLCSVASFNGWEVTVVSSIKDPKTIADFAGAHKVIAWEPLELDALLQTDDQTAVVLMTHNFARDLIFLSMLSHRSLNYVGLLGPVKRREQIVDKLLSQQPEIEAAFLDRLYGPAGLNISAETPQEIATSIVAEILSVTRNTNPKSLSSSNGSIHKQVEKISSF